ncbi:MAG: hypothetical protein R2831_07965 [Chitinophagaceae bacterium]
MKNNNSNIFRNWSWKRFGSTFIFFFGINVLLLLCFRFLFDENVSFIYILSKSLLIGAASSMLITIWDDSQSSFFKKIIKKNDK